MSATTKNQLNTEAGEGDAKTEGDGVQNKGNFENGLDVVAAVAEQLTQKVTDSDVASASQPVGKQSDSDENEPKRGKKRRIPDSDKGKKAAAANKDPKRAIRKELATKKKKVARRKRTTPCPHGKRTSYNCKDCGGKGICKHGRQKNYCIPCGGSAICTHGKQRSRCRDCGGSSFCAHGKRKSRCKDCGGSELCPHNIIKHYCKPCGGSATCEHGPNRSQCLYCGGASICPHRKRRTRCPICCSAKFQTKVGGESQSPAAQQIDSETTLSDAGIDITSEKTSL